MELIDLGGNPMITDSKCLGIELHDMLFTNIAWMLSLKITLVVIVKHL